MRRRIRWWTVALLPCLGACNDINTNPNAVVAVSLDSIASPSVVAGDTLRDTLGVVRPLRGTAYNYRNDPIADFPVKYRAIDPGLRVDTLTGLVIGDTARTISVRLLADAAGLQTQPIQLFVVPKPYQVIGVNTLDSVVYSLRDSSSIRSPALTVRVLPQDTLTTTVPIQGYLVSYAIQPLAASDTVWAQLVNASNSPWRVDTTGISGTAGQTVLIHPVLLPALTDSVVVLATVKYRGVPLVGSPVRFVLRVVQPTS